MIKLLIISIVVVLVILGLLFFAIRKDSPPFSCSIDIPDEKKRKSKIVVKKYKEK